MDKKDAVIGAKVVITSQADGEGYTWVNLMDKYLGCNAEITAIQLDTFDQTTISYVCLNVNGENLPYCFSLESLTLAEQEETEAQRRYRSKMECRRAIGWKG